MAEQEEVKRFWTSDGREVVIRSVRPEDAQRMVDFLLHLSPETRYRRFHTFLPNSNDETLLERAGETVKVPPGRGVALIALVGNDIVGSARCLREDHGPVAEAAVVVRDDYQRLGIGTQLLLELVNRARRLGITHLYAYIQPDNRRILDILQKAHLPTTTRLEDMLLRVEVDIRGEIRAS